MTVSPSMRASVAVAPPKRENWNETLACGAKNLVSKFLGACARKGQWAVVDAQGQWSTISGQWSMNDECPMVNVHPDKLAS